MYMNCAAVDIVGAEPSGDGESGEEGISSAQAALAGLPDLYVANLKSINDCMTKETTDSVFDNPGDDVIYGDDVSPASASSGDQSQCIGVGRKPSDDVSSSSSPSSPSPEDAPSFSSSPGTEDAPSASSSPSPEDVLLSFSSQITEDVPSSPDSPSPGDVWSPSSSLTTEDAPSSSDSPSFDDGQWHGDDQQGRQSNGDSGSMKPGACNDGQYRPRCWSNPSSSDDGSKPVTTDISDAKPSPDDQAMPVANVPMENTPMENDNVPMDNMPMDNTANVDESQPTDAPSQLSYTTMTSNDDDYTYEDDEASNPDSYGYEDFDPQEFGFRRQTPRSSTPASEEPTPFPDPDADFFDDVNEDDLIPGIEKISDDTTAYIIVKQPSTTYSGALPTATPLYDADGFPLVLNSPFESPDSGILLVPGPRPVSSSSPSLAAPAVSSAHAVQAGELHGFVFPTVHIGPKLSSAGSTTTDDLLSTDSATATSDTLETDLPSTTSEGDWWSALSNLDVTTDTPTPEPIAVIATPIALTVPVQTLVGPPLSQEAPPESNAPLSIPDDELDFQESPFDEPAALTPPVGALPVVPAVFVPSPIVTPTTLVHLVMTGFVKSTHVPFSALNDDFGFEESPFDEPAALIPHVSVLPGVLAEAVPLLSTSTPTTLVQLVMTGFPKPIDTPVPADDFDFEESSSPPNEPAALVFTISNIIVESAATMPTPTTLVHLVMTGHAKATDTPTRTISGSSLPIISQESSTSAAILVNPLRPIDDNSESSALGSQQNGLSNQDIGEPWGSDAANINDDDFPDSPESYYNLLPAPKDVYDNSPVPDSDDISYSDDSSYSNDLSYSDDSPYSDDLPYPDDSSYSEDLPDWWGDVPKYDARQAEQTTQPSVCTGVRTITHYVRPDAQWYAEHTPPPSFSGVPGTDSPADCVDPQWNCGGCQSPDRCVKINSCTRSCTRLPYTSVYWEHATATVTVHATPTGPTGGGYSQAPAAPQGDACPTSPVPYATGNPADYLPCRPGSFLCKSPTQFYTCGQFDNNGWTYGALRDVAAGMTCNPNLSQGSAKRAVNKRQLSDGDLDTAFGFSQGGDGGDGIDADAQGLLESSVSLDTPTSQSQYEWPENWYDNVAQLVDDGMAVGETDMRGDSDTRVGGDGTDVDAESLFGGSVNSLLQGLKTSNLGYVRKFLARALPRIRQLIPSTFLNSYGFTGYPQTSTFETGDDVHAGEDYYQPDLEGADCEDQPKKRQIPSAPLANAGVTGEMHIWTDGVETPQGPGTQPLASDTNLNVGDAGDGVDVDPTTFFGAEPPSYDDTWGVDDTAEAPAPVHVLQPRPRPYPVVKPFAAQAPAQPVAAHVPANPVVKTPLKPVAKTHAIPVAKAQPKLQPPVQPAQHIQPPIRPKPTLPSSPHIPSDQTVQKRQDDSSFIYIGTDGGLDGESDAAAVTSLFGDEPANYDQTYGVMDAADAAKQSQLPNMFLPKLTPPLVNPQKPKGQIPQQAQGVGINTPLVNPLRPTRSANLNPGTTLMPVYNASSRANTSLPPPIPATTPLATPNAAANIFDTFQGPGPVLPPGMSVIQPNANAVPTPTPAPGMVSALQPSTFGGPGKVPGWQEGDDDLAWPPIAQPGYEGKPGEVVKDVSSGDEGWVWFDEEDSGKDASSAGTMGNGEGRGEGMRAKRQSCPLVPGGHYRDDRYERL
jgi:hypothetical protein